MLINFLRHCASEVDSEGQLSLSNKWVDDIIFLVQYCASERKKTKKKDKKQKE